MRLTSLLLLVAIVGGIGYVLIFKKDWLFKTAQEGLEWAEGYGPAKSPSDAMNQFRQAIKARKFGTAAKYVVGPYNEHLTRASQKGVDNLGNILDQIYGYADNKGVLGETTKYVIYHFDPFPTSFKLRGEPTKIGEDKATGNYDFEGTPPVRKQLGGSDLGNLDPKMFNNNLTPSNFYSGIDLVREGSGDSAVWKLSFPITDIQRQAVDYYIDNFKGYETALGKFRDDLTHGRYDSADAFRREFLDVFRQAKSR